MRLKKWKLITIKNPALYRVRTSLRMVLRKAIDTKFNYLNKLRDFYREEALYDILVPSQERRENNLIRKSNQLLQAMTRSILRCSEGDKCILIRENGLSSDIAIIGEDMV